MVQIPAPTVLRVLLLALVCSASCPPVLAESDADVLALATVAQVGGKSLRLNGAGISFRLVFKVYAMGLYLPDTRGTVPEILALPGPRRLSIAMLRDVSGEEFDEKVMRYVSADGGVLQPGVTAHMLELANAISSQPQGLRKGDRLTLDWVPGTGTVIELNKKPLTEPIPEMAFYNALLNIWLGEKPADPALKARLLGSAGPMRTVMN